MILTVQCVSLYLTGRFTPLLLQLFIALILCVEVRLLLGRAHSVQPATTVSFLLGNVDSHLCSYLTVIQVYGLFPQYLWKPFTGMFTDNRGRGNFFFAKYFLQGLTSFNVLVRLLGNMLLAWGQGQTFTTSDSIILMSGGGLLLWSCCFALIGLAPGKEIFGQRVTARSVDCLKLSRLDISQPQLFVLPDSDWAEVCPCCPHM